LVTRTEKAAHFAACLRQQTAEEPARAPAKSSRPQADEPLTNKLPIGIDSMGHATFLYLVLPSAQEDFRTFLHRHADLF
ncbi:hypothetical protein ACQ7B2_18005, partial [Escherichia coli]